MKRAIITGGTGGLGSAIARRFKEDGWEVEALGRNDLELTDTEAVRGFFSKHGCDLLVCAAGAVRDETLFRMKEGTWEEVFSLNFTAAELCARSALPQMVERGNGHIVFISSYAALHPATGQAAYATAKSALLGLTKDLAARHGPQGIRVNAVLPGFLETPMTASVSAARRGEVRELHALGEFNTPDAAAAFLHFLHCGLPYTSGQVFQLDSRL